MDFVTIDIETTPIKITDQETIDYLMDKKIARYYHPFFSKIISIAVKENDQEPVLFSGDDEKKLLNEFWDHIASIKPPLIVTFNGYRFDIPFINIRSVIKGVMKKRDFNLTKWKMLTSDHFDCMIFLSESDAFTWVALAIACRTFGIQIPENRIGGEQVSRCYQSGDWNTIKEHNKQDVIMTEELFKKIRP